MHIIPVIDLLNGVVVHAKKGMRASYQPIVSRLTTSNKPLDIVKAFLDIYPFNTIYIADLNAIQGINDKNSTHIKIIEDITHFFPDLSLWLDAGISNTSMLSKDKKLNVHPVLGSENFANITDYQQLAEANNASHILSLDFLAEGYQGPAKLIADNQLWPKNVIIMTLNAVGAGTGIDMQTLMQFTQYAQQHDIYAAGGIRHLEDLKSLQQLSIKGALIASALHNKRLCANDLNAFEELNRQ